MLLDGEVFAPNPSGYAYWMATELYGYKNVRVLNLGTSHNVYNAYS